VPFLLLEPLSRAVPGAGPGFPGGGPHVGIPRNHQDEALHVNARDQLLFLAGCLDFAPSDAALRSRLSTPGLPWPEILAFTNKELLAPTLWVRLQEKGLTGELPPEVAATLRRSHAINSARNQRIRSELLEAIGGLNAVGIEPVVLKGGVDLVVPRYGDPGARILRDIDLFVQEEELATAVAALEGIGYLEAPIEDTKFVTYYADLTREGNLVGIDLQFYISSQRDLLAPEEAMSESERHGVDGVDFRILSPDHQIVHNLLHSEVQDRGGDVGFVWLRQLLDLVAIWRLYGDTVDWTGIETRFAAGRLPRLVSKRLTMAHRLLKVPLPEGITPSPAARLHYRRCLLQLRWTWIGRASALHATVTSAFDRRLMDVIYGSGPHGWRTGLNRVRHAIRLWGRHRGGLRGTIARRLRKFD